LLAEFSLFKKMMEKVNQSKERLKNESLSLSQTGIDNGLFL